MNKDIPGFYREFYEMKKSDLMSLIESKSLSFIVPDNFIIEN